MFFAHFLPPSILRLFPKTLRLFHKKLRLYQNSNKFDYRVKKNFFYISFYQYKNRMLLTLFYSVSINFLSLLRNSGKLWFIRYDGRLHNGDKLCNTLFFCIIIIMYCDYTLSWSMIELNCSIRTLNCSIRTLSCSIRTLNCCIRTLSCSIRTLNCSIRTLSCRIRTLSCSIRTLIQSCGNLNFRRIILIQSTQDLLNLCSNQSLETIKIYTIKTKFLKLKQTN